MVRPGAYLKLFRWRNLLIVALTQLLFRHAIILPAFQKYGHCSAMTGIDFSLLILATVMLCAAGYAINDYFDIRIDRINKPGSIVLDKLLSRREAIFSHSLLNFIAVSIAVYLSVKLNLWVLTLLYVLGAVVLWLYSIQLKRMLITGNIVVALMSSFVIGIVWFVEYSTILSQQLNSESWSRYITGAALLYGFFAFMTSAIREVIKDMEDKKGDAAVDCQSIPLVSGSAITKNIVIGLTLTLILGLAVFQAFLWMKPWYYLFWYFTLFVQLPLVFLIRMMTRSSKPSDYRKAQQLMKLIMLTGVLSMLFFQFNQ